MAKKHLSEDQINYILSADSSKLLQEYHKVDKETKALRKSQSMLNQSMLDLAACGKKNSEAYRTLEKESKEYGKAIKANEASMKEMRKKFDVNAMSMNQLKKHSKELQRELEDMSKAAEPEAYKKLEDALQQVNGRIAGLKLSAKGLTETFKSESTLDFMAANVMLQLAESSGKVLRSLIGSITETISHSVELAESADGISHAFAKLDSPGYLQSLRDATKGTVADVELMKAAVKAKDFRIPLEDLAKYLAFAQLKAQETGQSLDYMVDSIVTGLGRESPMILDNLGLSAAEIKEQTKQTGDFMKAVAVIVEKNLAAAGETYISAADRATRRTVALQNAQRELGESLLPLREEFEDSYGQMQVSVIRLMKYMVEHRGVLLSVGKVLGVLVATLLAYVGGQKLAYLWSKRAVIVEKAQAAALALKNRQLELSAIRQDLLNKKISVSIALQRLFNNVLKMSPWGLLLGGITLVVGALMLYRQRTDAAVVAQQKLNAIRSEAESKVDTERMKIEMLTRRIHDNSLSLDERQRAIARLQQIVPDYTAKLSKEGKVYEENTTALGQYLKKLEKKALLEGAQSQLSKLGEERAEQVVQQRELERKAGELREQYSKSQKNNMSHTVGLGAATVSGSTYSDATYAPRMASLEAEIRNKKEEISKIDTLMKTIFDVYGGEMFDEEVQTTTSSYIGTVGAEIENLTKKIDALKAQRLAIKVGDTKSLKAIDEQISALEKRKKKLEGDDKSDKTDKADKADERASKRLSRDRAHDLDEAKRAYQEDQRELQKALMEKRITQEQYNAYVAALNIEHQNNLLRIEQSYRAKSISIQDRTKRKEIQEEQDKAVAEQQQAVQNAYLESERQFYDALERLQSEKTNARPKTLQEECDAKLLILERYYQAQYQMAQEDAARQAQLTKAFEEAKTAIAGEYAQKIEEQKTNAREKYGLRNFEEQLAAEREKVEEDYKKGLLTKEQYELALEKVEQDAQNRRQQVRQQYGLASQQELYNAELEQLKQHLANGLISEEEYAEAVKKMKIAKHKEAFDYYSNLSSGAVQALMQAEEANVDAKYDAEIEAARNAGKDTTELEKKKADEKLKIQKKYADVNFAIKASQIIADTAVSIMRAYSDLGPIAGSIAAALMGITGVAQLKAANAERQRVKKMTLSGSGSSSASGTRVATGLESGGSIDVEREQDGKHFRAAYDPDRRGYVDRPTVIVGEGPVGQSREWVASNAAVENPTVAPLLDIIDHAQRAGNIRTLDMSKFLAQQTSGRASGGSISPRDGVGPLPIEGANNGPLLEKVYALLEHLSTNGISAAVALNELEQKQKLRDQARNFGKK